MPSPPLLNEDDYGDDAEDWESDDDECDCDEGDDCACDDDPLSLDSFVAATRAQPGFDSETFFATK